MSNALFITCMGVFVAALVAIYMARARFVRVVISAAQFFINTPATSSSKWQFGPPQLTRSFAVQLAILLLLLIAGVVSQIHAPLEQQRRLGVWILLDRSASMTTIQDGHARMDAARDALHVVVDRAKARQAAAPPCFKLSAFDLSLEDFPGDRYDAAELFSLASAVRPRALGTDLGLVQQVIGSKGPETPRPGPATGCAVNHVVVVTDTPAPTWIAGAGNRVDWLDISQPTANIGLTEMASKRDLFSGKVERVQLQVEAFGPMNGTSRVTVKAPDGSVKLQQDLHPGAERAWSVMFKPEAPGRYQIDVAPGGNYHFDDHAEIDIPAASPVRADWRAGRRDLLAQLGWQQDSAHPEITIVPVSSKDASAPESPAILVGNGFQRRPPPVVPIWAFWETSPLLSALNLDVAERLSMPVAGLPENFIPVLAGEAGPPWIAQRNSPPAAYIPGLPLEGDDAAARFSTTLFFNAARWILERREQPPLFRLTSPREPEPKGTLLALHPGEGNTGRTPLSYGSLDFSPDAGSTDTVRKRSIWPYLLAAAVVVFLMERRQAFFGGERWR